MPVGFAKPAANTEAGRARVRSDVEATTPYDELNHSVAALLLRLHDIKARADVTHVSDDLVSLEDSIRELLTISSRHMSPPASAGPALSDRELHVLAHVADGLSNKQVARRMGISEKTVRNHLTRIFHKLGVVTRTEAVVTAIQAGKLLV